MLITFIIVALLGSVLMHTISSDKFVKAYSFGYGVAAVGMALTMIIENLYK